MVLDPYRHGDFVLHHYVSPTVQEVEFSRQHEDGGKQRTVTWSTKSEGVGVGPVKPVHMVLRTFFQGPVENLAAT